MTERRLRVRHRGEPDTPKSAELRLSTRYRRREHDLFLAIGVQPFPNDDLQRFAVYSPRYEDTPTEWLETDLVEDRTN